MGHPEDKHLADNALGVPGWGVGLGIPACALLAVARHYGYVAQVPLALICGELMFVLVAMALFTSWFPPGSSRARPRLHMCLQIAIIGLIIYTLGWGSILAVGFIVPAINIMSADGSSYGPWAIGCIAVTVLVGEVGVSLGVFESLVPGHLGYGLALLEVAGASAVVWILTFNQREKEAIERSVVDSERRFRSLVQNASDIILVVGEDGTISYASPSFTTTLGYPATESIGMQAHLLLEEEDVARLSDLIRSSSHSLTHRTELLLRHYEGSRHWCEATFTDLLDTPGINGWVANLRDITERKAIGDQLAFEAAHDVMTGLCNRATFIERVDDALSQETGPVAVLFVDLDHFKNVNDGLGHAVGDELLIDIAQRLRRVMRPGDVLARFGGDEFVVLCTKVTGIESATLIAERLLTALAEPISIAGEEVFVTASIGIALSDDTDTAETLLRQADVAMYQAKNEGRAHAVAFDSERHHSSATILKTGNDLHRALDRDELVLHYQPIVDLCLGRVTGFEALLRWDHPERGLLLPVDFLDLAEETGLIVPIGSWVLETACRQTVEWQQARPRTAAASLVINVNLAARQVADPNIVKTVARVIQNTKIAPSALCLELTESTLMYDTSSAIDVLHALRGQGVHLSIDDFGTGYSSLSYLKKFPVESLKIDRTFISGLGQYPDDTAIVQTVVALAHSLNVVAVAEGVETPVQLEMLRSLGCDFAQGFFFGQPLPAESIGAHSADNLTAWQQRPLALEAT